MNRQLFLDRLLADHVLDLTDTDGRPLVEPLLPLTAPRRCAYGDLRDGRPLNWAGLQQVSEHWRSLRRRVAAVSDGTLQGAFRASLAIVTAPLLTPEGEAVAAELSAAYKACIGFNQVFCHMLLSGLAPDAALNEVASSADFFEWLQSGDWLLGQHQACAGSPAQIQELYGAFCQSQTQPAPAEQVELALEAVALQSALVLATYRSVAEGQPESGGIGQRLWQHARWPWMHAVTNQPGRDPACVACLFKGPLPPSVRTFLTQERPEMEAVARDQLFATLYWSNSRPL